MQEKMSKKTDVRAWVIAAFIAALVLAMWYASSGNPHSAYNDPIYKGQLEAEKTLRDANAIPVRIVK